MTKTAFPLFDGHNDSLTRFHKQDEGNLDGFLVRNHEGHLDLPRALDAGLAGGLFAIHAPDSLGGVTMSEEPRQDDGTAYKFDLPPELDQAKASEFTHEVFSGLENLASSSDGISIVKDFDMLQTCIETGQLAVIPHIEGAEAISADLSNLDDFYNRGLRSLGLVWSRPNRFGHGVPFAFPFSPDTGPGLTDAGKELVRALNQNGILIDLSHLNEKGFWQVADLTEAPLVASHSNAWELCRSTRNLTDKQLEAIAESEGLVGVNFCVGFLRADGRPNTNTPFSVIADHVDYIAQKAGIDHVAFGSDFDGATIPDELGDVTGFSKILAILRQRGYAESDLRRICCDNWLRVLRATWHLSS